MEIEEISQRFINGEPAKGLAFSYNDAVEIIAGPHRGAGGSVVVLQALTPEPTYVVELGTGQDVVARQSELAGLSTAGALAELQRWYSAQCDGDWEHGCGIKIETLDNPGWSVTINLAGTELADTAFAEFEDLFSERQWIHCIVKEQRFEGHGGPNMLGQIIRKFLEWANRNATNR